MRERPYLIHALTPLHAGTGRGSDAVDLPIARLAGSCIPIVPGSSIKGVLRDARQGSDPQRWRATFGPERDASDHSGALVCTDARLLALPVRSFKGVFAYVTSPLLLRLAERDLGVSWGGLLSISERARVTGEALVHRIDGSPRLFIEDLELQAEIKQDLFEPFAPIARCIYPDTPGIVLDRLTLVDDDTMSWLMERSTQIDTRVRIDRQTGTVAEGQLWTEESLPAESILVGLLAAENSRGSAEMSPEEILDFAFPRDEILQIGGKATIGRGRCKLVRFHQPDPKPRRRPW